MGEKADLCENTEKLHWTYGINEENHKTCFLMEQLTVNTAEAGSDPLWLGSVGRNQIEALKNRISMSIYIYLPTYLPAYLDVDR